MSEVYLVGFTGFDYPHMDVRAICDTPARAEELAKNLNESTHVMPWNGVVIVGPLNMNELQEGPEDEE